MVKTYWNGEPTVCRRVRVLVGPAPFSTWWCAGLVGKERNAVEVCRPDMPVFFIDDEAFSVPKDQDISGLGGHNAGIGWLKVTEGKGNPVYYHAELPVAEVLREIPQ